MSRVFTAVLPFNRSFYFQSITGQLKQAERTTEIKGMPVKLYKKKNGLKLKYNGNMEGLPRTAWFWEVTWFSASPGNGACMEWRGSKDVTRLSSRQKECPLRALRQPPSAEALERRKHSWWVFPFLYFQRAPTKQQEFSGRKANEHRRAHHNFDTFKARGFFVLFSSSEVRSGEAEEGTAPTPRCCRDRHLVRRFATTRTNKEKERGGGRKVATVAGKTLSS